MECSVVESTRDLASRGSDFTQAAVNHGADAVYTALSEDGSPPSGDPITLVAVPREWWPPPTRISELSDWRDDHGEATRKAANDLRAHGYDEVGLALGEGPVDAFTVLEHADAIIVRAVPQRAAAAADLLAQSFVLTPDVVLPGLWSDGAQDEVTGERSLTRPGERVSRDSLADLWTGWPACSGVPRAHERGNHGQEAAIAVLDTGCDADHEEISDRTVDFAYFPPDGPVRRVRGFDTSWHGTHVAGIAAGQTIGVAPQARLMCGSVLGGDRLETVLSRLVRGINWVAGQMASLPASTTARIVNMSLGIREDWVDSPRKRDALAAVAGALGYLMSGYGALIVAAVGNDGPGSGPRAPAYIPGVLAVGAVDFERDVAAFSSGGRGPAPFNHVETPSVAGFGVDVLSSMERDAFGESHYCFSSGTSMAAPYVAGVAALAGQETGHFGPDLKDWIVGHAQSLPANAAQVGAGLARIEA
jgi:subtilisin family serine protease